MLLDVINCKLSSVVVWITPPAGTLSRARDRPLKRKWIDAGVPESPPLLSDAHPLGLPSALACPRLAAQLSSANALVKFTFAAVQAARARGCPWFVAGPKNSYLWSFPDWSGSSFTDVDYALCAYGGPRPKPEAKGVQGSKL